MTPLRTRAIDAILKEWDDGLPLSASLAVDALLAANLLHDPTATIDAAPCGATDSGAPVVGAPRTATSSGPCFGATWKPAPRDDEARIERAARAVGSFTFDSDGWVSTDAGIPLWDLTDDACEIVARAALAAADQEDTDA